MIHAAIKDGKVDVSTGSFYFTGEQQETFCVYTLDVCIYSIRTNYYYSSICCSISFVRLFSSGLEYFQCFPLFFIYDFG